jgi:hypothetical protein
MIFNLINKKKKQFIFKKRNLINYKTMINHNYLKHRIKIIRNRNLTKVLILNKKLKFKLINAKLIFKIVMIPNCNIVFILLEI